MQPGYGKIRQLERSELGRTYTTDGLAKLPGQLFSDIIPTDPEWLWPGHILSADVNLLVGTRKVGKRFLTASIASRVSRGWPMPPADTLSPLLDPEQERTPGFVVGCWLEDSSSMTTVHTLKAAGADLSKIYDMSRIKRSTALGTNTARSKFSLPQDIGLLRAVIQELGDVRYVVVDPLMSGATQTVSFNQQLRMRIIDPLQELAEETGIAFQFVGHFTKGMTLQNIEDKIGGSAGLLDAMRVVDVVIHHPLKPGARLLMNLYNNLMPVNDGGIEYIIAGEPPYDSHIRYPLQRVDEDNTEQLEAVVLAMLMNAARPLSSQEMATYLRISHGIVVQILAKQKSEGNVEKIRGVWQPRAIEAPQPESATDAFPSLSEVTYEEAE